jgi:hypothetical protein
VKLAQQALKARLALTELMAQLGLQALRVQPDPKVQRVLKGQLVLPAQMVLMGQMVLMVLMGQPRLLLLAQFRQAQPDQAPQLQIQGVQAQLFLRLQFHKALLARLVLLEPTAQPELLDHKALQAQLVQREQPDHKVLREPMVPMVQMALQP